MVLEMATADVRRLSRCNETLTLGRTKCSLMYESIDRNMKHRLKIGEIVTPGSYDAESTSTSVTTRDTVQEEQWILRPASAISRALSGVSSGANSFLLTEVADTTKRCLERQFAT